MSDTQLATVQPRDTTPEGLMALGIEKGLSVEGLEKLMCLASQVREQRAKSAFIAALGAFQAECPVIEKTRIVMDKNGQKVRYKFAAMEDIKEVIGPLLGRHGLSYTFDTSVGDKLVTVFCIVRHDEGHSEQSSFVVPIGSSGFMSAPQEFASALTYCKRYALVNSLGLAVGDEDTDAAPPEKPQQPAQQARQATPPAQTANQPPNKTELDLAVAEWTARLDADPNIKELNAMLPLMGSLSQNVKRVIWGLIKQRTEAAGLEWDPELKIFSATVPQLKFSATRRCVRARFKAKLFRDGRAEGKKLPYTH